MSHDPYDDPSSVGGKRARPSDASPPSEARCRHLRVSSLPGNCTHSELRLMFEPYGRVEDVRVLRAGSQVGAEGAAADVGLVDMSCTREATNAKKTLDGVQLRGCPLSVAFDLQRRDEANGAAQAAAPPPPPEANKAPRRADSNDPRPLPRLAGTNNAPPPPGMPKIPLFFVPERWLRDVHNYLVIKMRSVLWSSTEDDVRAFFAPIRLPPEAVEMGRDWEGRFSGQVYVRFRSADDSQRAMEKRNTPLCGRPVQITRVDPNNKIFFPPGANIFSPAAARAAYERAKAERERAEVERMRLPAAEREQSAAGQNAHFVAGQNGRAAQAPSSAARAAAAAG